MVTWPAEVGAAVVRELQERDLPAALALCAIDPVAAVLAAVRLEESGVGGRWGPVALGAFQYDELVGLAWAGANFVPVSPRGQGLAALARSAMTRRFSSLVGEATAVHTIWSHLALAWPPPRQIRNQPSLALTGAPAVAPHPQLRAAREQDVDILLPASVAMFTEEYGYSPLGAGGGYAQRVRSLASAGRSFLITDPATSRVLFKAEIGALALGVAQVQGVWVDPGVRGQGLGAAGTAAVVERAYALGAHTVSLYVNDYNAPARRTYRSVGFEQVGEYATVVL